MVKCQICNKKFKKLNGLSKHISQIHKNITIEDYYKKFLKQKNEGICKMYGTIPSCRKHTAFHSLSYGYITYCSVKCSKNDPEIKERCKQTSLKKYGVEYPTQSKEVMERTNQTNLKKYGVKNFLQSKEVRKRIKQTNLNKYGVEDLFQSKEIREKIKKTCLDKYGVESPLQSEEIREKIKLTNIEKYGVETPFQVTKIRKVIEKNRKINQELKIKKHLKFFELELLDEFVSMNRKKSRLLCRRCGTVFETVLDYIFHGYGFCPICFPRNKSQLEQEIIIFIKQLLPKIEILENSRQIIPPFELDIYIPEKQIAIEFNGLYWHSEGYKDKNYHLNKTIVCEKQGIRLIHIFEDEWLFKQGIVKPRLRQILNISNTKRLHARKCIVREITSKEKNRFLERYHIQGKDTSRIKLGAFYNNKLVAVMTFSKPSIAKGQKKRIDGIWELNRFCSHSDFHIPGIASKLLKYFERNYDWQEIFSYADRRWSDGDLYYKLGFELSHITKPNYWYVNGFKRIHRFNLRKKHNEPKDIPEWILRQKEGYSRIWDCGSLRFKLLLKELK